MKTNKKALRWGLVVLSIVVSAGLTYMIVYSSLQLVDTNKKLLDTNRHLKKVIEIQAQKNVVLKFDSMSRELEVKECQLETRTVLFYLQACVDEMSLFKDNKNVLPEQQEEIRKEESKYLIF